MTTSTVSIQEKGAVKTTPTWSGAKPIPLLATLLVGLAIWVSPKPEGLTTQAWHLFAIFASIIVGLISRPLPLAPVVLMGTLAAILTKTLTFNDVFQGFAKESIWLIVTSFFLAQGLIKTGLAIRASYIFVMIFGKRTLGLAYGIIISELILAPFIPSLVARSAGIIFPIVLALAKTADDEEKGPTGRYLLVTTFQCSCIVSAMFLTSMAANPIAVSLASEFGIEMTWGRWILASCVPGLISLITVPLLTYKLLPPANKETPEAPKIASSKLLEMGKMKRNEWLMLGVFSIVLFFWLAGSKFGVNNAVAALIGLMALLLCGVISWKDCLKESTAWDTLFWLGALIAIGTQLKAFGFFDWFSMSIVSYIQKMTWHWAFMIMSLVYFYSHYFFASNTAHLTAMFSAFLAAALSIGAPPFLTVLILGFTSSLFGGLTHYGCGPAPIYFGAGYLTLKKWWKMGLIISIVNILIWFGIGSVWWKVIGLW